MLYKELVIPYSSLKAPAASPSYGTESSLKKSEREKEALRLFIKDSFHVSLKRFRLRGISIFVAAKLWASRQRTKSPVDNNSARL